MRNANKKLLQKTTRKNQKLFQTGDFAIYPSHGVGKILEVETIKAANQKFELLKMYFEQEKLVIKVPVSQIDKIGIRHLATKAKIEEIFVILRSGVKKLKGMWSRRAQEYESKINSGNIVLLAEVIRDLTRDIEDGDRSYSERIIYETAIYRLASEYAAIAGISFEKAREEIIATAKNKIGVVEELREVDLDDNEDEDSDDDNDDEEEDDEDADAEDDDED